MNLVIVVDSVVVAVSAVIQLQLEGQSGFEQSQLFCTVVMFSVGVADLIVVLDPLVVEINVVLQLQSEGQSSCEQSQLF